MSSVAFITLAIFTLAAALAAALRPKLVHAALCFAAAFVGVAGLYFLLGAEFVGLVQIFVYVGAVAVLIVFTILLTRRETEPEPGFHWSGAIVAAAIFAGLVWTIARTPGLKIAPAAVKLLTVRQIGEVLMTDYVWPLQCVGLLLTAALLGALILVLEENDEPVESRAGVRVRLARWRWRPRHRELSSVRFPARRRKERARHTRSPLLEAASP